MHLSALWEIFRQYFVAGIVLLLLLGGLLAVGYLLYRRVFKGKRRLPWLRLLVWGAFLLSLVIIFGATFFIRSSTLGGRARVLPLFYLYRQAWYDFTAANWRNQILNVAMFVPIGFLLPFMSRVFKRWYWTVLAAFFLTAFIETVQLLLGLGTSSLDDVLNNTVGAAIGYGLVMAVPSRKFGRYLAPFLVTVLAFGGIFTAYHFQEFGNFAWEFFEPVKMDSVAVSTAAVFGEMSETAKIFEVNSFTRTEADAVAMAWSERLGSDFRPFQLHDTVIFYESESAQLMVEYRTGGYRLIRFASEVEPDRALDENEVRALLNAYGVAVPAGLDFEVMGNGNYRFLAMDSELFGGHIGVTVVGDSQLSQLEYWLYPLQFVAEREIISWEDALAKVKAGEFQFWWELQTLEILSINLNHRFDSKGFYRPVYVFETLANGEPFEILIAAED